MSHSFTDKYLESIQLDRSTLATVGEVYEHKGKQALYKQAAPGKLEELRKIAVIESADFSNRIEGVVISADRLIPVLTDNSKPVDRDEHEVLGYKQVLDMIHKHHGDMQLTPNLILQFHRDLMSYSPGIRGKWKNAPNQIIAKHPDGKQEVLFEPVAPHLVEKEMGKLTMGLNAAWQDTINDRLLLIAAYVLDFLCIHPFHDGNGRVSRLLTLLLLYKADFLVGQYISLERIIESTKEDYYRALRASNQRWHEGEHNLNPLLLYLAKILLAAYRELDEKTIIPNRTERVMAAIRRLPANFKTAYVIALCADVPKQTIRNTLSDLGKEGYIRSTGKGRGASWVKNDG